MSTPSGSPWNRSRVIFNVRPAVRAQRRFISDRNFDLVNVCVPHREWRKRRAAGPRRRVASITNGVMYPGGIAAGLLTRE